MNDLAKLQNRNAICLIACGKQKLDLNDGETAKAVNLYTAIFFQIKDEFADKFCQQKRILSAKHNLLKPDEQIEEYDASLIPAHDSYIGDDEVVQWGKDTRSQLEELDQNQPEDTIYVVLASGPYVEQISEFLADKNSYCPFEEGDFGGNGDQMGWMRTQIDNHPDKHQGTIGDW